MKKIMLSAVVVIPVVAIILTSLGCGRKPKGIPDLRPCSVTLTMEGKPLADATIAFVPVTKEKWFVSGTTDTNGNVTMNANGQYPGAPEGSYKVTVDKMVGDPNWNPKTDEERERGEILKPAVDSVFSSASTTPLECTVVKGKNTFTFDVKPVK